MNTISYNKFIFSDEKSYRFKRHLLFWVFWGIYFGLVRELNTRYFLDNGHFPNLNLNMAQAFIKLLPQTVLVYPLLYFILPRYAFNGKYIKAWLLIITLVLILISINAVLLMTVPWYEVYWLESKISLLSKETTLSAKFSMAFLLALQGSFAGAGLAVCFKMFKDHYVKNIRNQQLLKENIEAQLQLLRAQVHPHFLFNTLNNIYSQTQLESPKGSKMILGLSDMLRYILYEGQKPLVPLKLELMMITEYINLEKIRYGNKLDVHMLTPDKTDDIYIAPLILLPFVENCFKHGTSNMLQNPWINLTIELKDSTLVMKLINGKTSLNGNGQNKAGIGINNVRQRLELLYNDKHDLQIREDEEVFVIDLRMELVRIENKEQADMFSQPQPTVEYV
jgi:LytS/YehU family sensor histidine kinase